MGEEVRERGEKGCKMRDGKRGEGKRKEGEKRKEGSEGRREGERRDL